MKVLAPGFLLRAAIVAVLLAQPGLGRPHGEHASGPDDGPPELHVGQRLPWEYQSLDLLLWSLQKRHERVEVRFALELRSGFDDAAVTVGYPRYASSRYRWADAVTIGLPPGSRILRVSADDPSRRVFFSALVPVGTRSIRLPLGGDMVEVGVESWIAELHGVASRHAGTGASASGAHREGAGVPVQLTARVRWEGETPFGDGALDAGEAGELLVDVANRGDRATHGVRVRVVAQEFADVAFPPDITVPVIEPGGTETVRVPLRGGPQLTDATLELTIEVLEEFGHDAPKVKVSLDTRAAPTSRLVLVDDFAVEGAGLPVPRDKIVTVRLRVRNVGHGTAEKTVAEVLPAVGVFRAEGGAARFELGDLPSGEIREIEYRCYANQRAETLRLHVDLLESRTRDRPSTSVVDIPLEGSGGTARIVRIRAETSAEDAVRLSPAPAPLTSDVDRSIPRSRSSRPNALAVVLGVEEYGTAPSATFATDDARTAASYFEHVLGIPGDRIQVLVDHEVTLGQFHRIFGERGWLARRADAGTEIFVYFAGHGIAEPGGATVYLMPADSDMNYFRQTGFSLDAMIGRLVALDVRNVALFLDTCFSGATRQGEALMAGARPLVLVPEPPPPMSAVSIYSAATGAQIAHSLDDQGHGLFTYYLFLGLGGAADRDGDHTVTAAELKRHLELEVPRAAGRIDREQTPSVVLRAEDEVLVELE